MLYPFLNHSYASVSLQFFAEVTIAAAFFLTLSHEILPTLKPSGPENLVKGRIGTNTKVIAGLQIALLEPITIILLPQ